MYSGHEERSIGGKDPLSLDDGKKGKMTRDEDSLPSSLTRFLTGTIKQRSKSDTILDPSRHSQ